jgi:hypothetical protein
MIRGCAGMRAGRRRTAMDVRNQSAELIRRGDRLRARSARICAVADENVENSWRLIAAAARAQETMTRAHGWERARRTARAAADGVLGDR